jgi:DNA primase
LGLDLAGRAARCFNGQAHRGGEDASPSLVFFPDSGRFNCFGCGVRGDAIDLVRQVHGVSFREAVAWLERLAQGSPGGGQGAASTRPPPGLPNETALQVYQRLHASTCPPAPASPAGQYLIRRGLDLDLAGHHGAREMLDAAAVCDTLTREFGDEQLAAAGLVSRKGYFLFGGHSLLFFYLDGGRPVFLQARDITGTAGCKELRPSGVPCPVPFNRNVLSGPLERVYVCEGCIDTLSALQLGYPAVGVPGVQTFREDWYTLFSNAQTVCILFDDDEAGRQQGPELAVQFRLRGFHAEAHYPTRGKDVNDLLQILQQGVDE